MSLEIMDPCFHTGLSCDEPPEIFPSPFQVQPHKIAIEAAEKLQQHLDPNTEGKMFGVLVVEQQNGQLGYLCAFSGMLDGKWVQDGFVPPVFDLDYRQQLMPENEKILESLSHQINQITASFEYRQLLSALDEAKLQAQLEKSELASQHHQKKIIRATSREKAHAESDTQTLNHLSFESQADKRVRKQLLLTHTTLINKIKYSLAQFDQQISDLKSQRLQLSQQLQKQLFGSYNLFSVDGQSQVITCFFKDKLPPGGSGDCALPKLLQYANCHDYKPIAMAEFWYGQPASQGVRYQGNYYPPCRGKCRPILDFMLQGLEVAKEPQLPLVSPTCDIERVYEDDYLLVLNKPPGLLSIPGKSIDDSVYERMRKAFPNASGPLLVHRLDMSTSGLLLIAKSSSIHKQLQAQFIQRTVKKRYMAILSHRLAAKEGVIELPLRVDLDDRPRQLVCFEHGKAAKTNWQWIENVGEGCRVYFYPRTGRTHQLRLHAAHPQGLASPIVGDELYGEQGRRLMLHAEQLAFTHPITGQWLELEAGCDF